MNGERQSLIRLGEVLQRSIEVLELWRILADHQFGVLVAQLPGDIKELLYGITLKQLITKGKEVCRLSAAIFIRHFTNKPFITQKYCNESSATRALDNHSVTHTEVA